MNNISSLFPKDDETIISMISNQYHIACRTLQMPGVGVYHVFVHKPYLSLYTMQVMQQMPTPSIFPFLSIYMYACTWTYKLKRKSSRTPQSSSYSCNDAALWSENLSSLFIFVPRHEPYMKTRGQWCELGLLERDRSQNEKKITL